MPATCEWANASTRSRSAQGDRSPSPPSHEFDHERKTIMTQNIDAAAFNWHPFGDGWTVEREGAEPVEVELPHDAMIGEQRHPDAPSGPHGAFFPGGTYRSRKRAALPLVPSGQRAILLFEG